MPKWNGSVVIWPNRILFAGEAAQSELHDSHTLMICVAFGGKLSLQLSRGGSWDPFTAVIIDSETLHCIDGLEAKFVALIHLLPETEEARKLKRKYLAGRGVHEIPERLAEKLLAYRKTLEDFWLLDCETAGEICGGIIGKLIKSPSTRLDRDVEYHVRRAIKELYWRMDEKLKNGPAYEDNSTASSVVNKLRLDEKGWTEETLKRELKKNTGATFDEYVKLLRFRATLVKIARNEAELRAAPGQSKISGKKTKQLREISLTEAASWMGWGELYNLTRASTAILGINPSSLKDSSRFIECEENSGQ